MASNQSHGGSTNGMEIVRHALGLVATWTFSSGLFFLPLLAVFFWRVSSDAPLPSAAGDTGFDVAMFDASWGGGGGQDGTGADEALDGTDAEAPSEEVIPGTEEGAPAAAAPSTGAQASGSRGTGGGRGGGTGTGTGTGTGAGAAITMYRPGGGPDLAQGMGGTAKCEPLVTGIVNTGPDAWSVERQLVDDYANLKMAKTLIGGIERHQNDLGEYDGVQIFGIPCGSPLQLAGFKNGDVIHDINGMEITGIPAGLLAWRKLRDDDVLEVNVTRRGKPRRLVFTLS